MNDLTKPNGAAGVPALPDDYAARLGAGIAESRATTHLAGGKDFLRMLKSGDWVYGAESIEVQEGSHWVVNVMSLSHGWCCWVDTGNKNELAGEVMVPMTDRKPLAPPPINGQPFVEQRAFDLKCLNGEDEGKEVQFKTNSLGGMKAVDGLLAIIHRQLAAPEGRAHPCPVLQLDSDHYEHPKYGRIYTPVLNVVGWANMMGELAGAAPKQIAAMDEGAPEAQMAPSAPVEQPKRRRAAAAPAATPETVTVAAKDVGQLKVADAPAPTQRQHAGQRRRPAVR